MATATMTAKKVSIRPLDDRILIQPCDPEEMTAGGIILPDNAREKQQRGTVIAIGPGKLLDSGERATPAVKVGDEVFYGKYSGTEVEVSGEDMVICRETDILAVITKK